MLKLGELLKEIQPPKKQKPPSHEKAAMVNEIIEVTGKSDIPYSRWLRMVGKRSYGDILEICKTARSLDQKYNKVGFIINKLKVK